jgi:hypothetical protein
MLDHRRLGRVIAWWWGVFVCLTTLPALADQHSSLGVRGMHDGDRLMVGSRTRVTGTWTCAAGVATCKEDDEDGGNATSVLSAGDVVILQTGSVWYDYEVASVEDDHNFTRRSTLTAQDGSTENETFYAVAASACWEINQGVTSTLSQVISAKGQLASFWMSTLYGGFSGSVSLYPTSVLYWGSSGFASPDVDISRSAASTLSINNGDGSGGDGNLVVNQIDIGGGFGSTGCTFSSGGAASCNSYFSSSSFIQGTILYVSAVPTSYLNRAVLGNTGLIYEGTEDDAGEFFVDWSGFTTSDYDYTITIPNPAGADKTVVFPDQSGTVDLRNVGSIADDDTTPDVSGGDVFWTVANTTGAAITDLDNPVVGRIYTICIGNATNPTNIADGGNFHLSAAWAPDLDDCIGLLVRTDNDYVEVYRSAN